MIRPIEVTYHSQTARTRNTAPRAKYPGEPLEIPQTPPRGPKKHGADPASMVTLAEVNTSISGEKRVKKKNVEFAGPIDFIEGATTYGCGRVSPSRRG